MTLSDRALERIEADMIVPEDRRQEDRRKAWDIAPRFEDERRSGVEKLRGGLARRIR